MQYIRFRFSDEQRAAFTRGEREARLVIAHSHYNHSTLIEGEVRSELARDFEA